MSSESAKRLRRSFVIFSEQQLVVVVTVESTVVMDTDFGGALIQKRIEDTGDELATKRLVLSMLQLRESLR